MTVRRVIPHRALAAGLILGATAAVALGAAPVRAADLLTGGIALAPSALTASVAPTQGSRRLAPLSTEALFFGIASRERTADGPATDADPTRRALGMSGPALTADIFGLAHAPDDPATATAADAATASRRR